MEQPQPIPPPGHRRVALLVETTFASGRHILEGIARYIREHEPWSVYFEPRSIETAIPRWLRRWQGDGIIVRIQNRSITRAILAAGAPAVDTLGVVANAGLPLVHVDNEAIARAAAEHLVERGFKQFGCCAVRSVNWSTSRCDTFRRTIAVWGHPCGVVRLPEHTPSDGFWEREQDRLARWIAELPKPAGVFAVNDNVGLRVLDACRRAGVAVPDQVAVVGADNDETVCQVSNPPLSSVATAHVRVGYEAARLLAALMSGEAPPSSAVLVPPGGVAVRASSDVLAIDDRQISQAVRLIRQRACAGLSVEDVAAQTGMSRTTLKRRFQAVLGKSVHDEINAVQLARVKQLLAETELPLKQIAKRAGYPHASYLIASFKRLSGTTPGQYRKQRQKGNGLP